MSTEAGVLLPSTSSWSASSANWFALPARPAVRLLFRAVTELWLAAMRPLCRREVRGQRVGRQVGRGRQGVDLVLQVHDGRRVVGRRGGVGRDACGVGGRVRDRRVGGEHGGQLPGGDAALGRRAAIVQDVACDATLEQGHVRFLLVQHRHARAAERDHLQRDQVDVELLSAVRLKIFE